MKPVVIGQPVNLIEIVVPAGAYPGNQLLVTNPFTQQQFQVTVPQGLAPGMTFQVQVPSGSSPAAPMMQSQPVPMMQHGGMVMQQPNVVHHRTTVVRERRSNDDDCVSGFLAGLCFCCLASAVVRR